MASTDTGSVGGLCLGCAAVFDRNFAKATDKRHSTPAGVPAISRGSSEATPPDTWSVIDVDPGGVAATLPAGRTALRSDQATDQTQRARTSCEIETFRKSFGSGTPAGVRSHSRFVTGDVAPLNPRLIAVTPAGVEMKIAVSGWKA